MKKIAGLLKEIGASDELVGQICEHFDSYDIQVHAKYKEAYNKKLSKVKSVCIEQVDKYKLSLGKKVSVFLESKSTEIEKGLERNRAIEEAEAGSKLRDIKNLVENIEVADDAEIKALKEEVTKLATDNETLKKSKKSAEVNANRANEMALALVRENKSYADKESTASKPAPKTKKVEESKVKSNKKTVSEGMRKRKLKSSKPKTTRKTLKESQEPAKRSRSKNVIPVDSDIASIASGIE